MVKKIYIWYSLGKGLKGLTFSGSNFTFIKKHTSKILDKTDLRTTSFSAKNLSYLIILPFTTNLYEFVNVQI